MSGAGPRTGRPQRTALVVGGGIGGLAAGIALRRAGWRPLIFERAANPRELGFALNLAPNAMAALAEIGLAERLRAEGAVTRDIEIRAGDGTTLRRLDVAAAQRDDGWTSVVALRRTLYGALLDSVHADELVLASEVVGYESTGAGVTLVLRDGRVFEGAVLVGADGIHSTVRRKLHPNEAPLRASGYHGVRGVAYDVDGHLDGHSAVGYLGDGYEAAAAGAGMGAVYWYVSLRTSDLVSSHPDPTDVLAEWMPRFPPPLRAIMSATKTEDRRIDALFDRDPLPVWGAGPVTLLGDAAHPMMPHTGQGAAQALEDAVALGLALGRSDDPTAALRAYERVRASRTSPIVRIGRRIPRTTTTRSRMVQWLRTAAIRTLPASLMIRGIYLGGNRDPHGELR